LFTVKDATFNRLVEDVNSETGRQLVEKTNIVEKIAKYLDLEYNAEAGDEGDFGGGGFGDFGGGGFGQEETPAEEVPAEEAPATDTFEAPSKESPVEEPSSETPPHVTPAEEKMADEVADELSPSASEEEVRRLVDDKFGG